MSSLAPTRRRRRLLLTDELVVGRLPRADDYSGHQSAALRREVPFRHQRSARRSIVAAHIEMVRSQRELARTKAKSVVVTRAIGTIGAWDTANHSDIRVRDAAPIIQTRFTAIGVCRARLQTEREEPSTCCLTQKADI